ncbi:C40 family peptidase [Alkalibacterium kapii]|uniref:Peptidase P60 n=1 Tax=Alkalibacterium kapii TaxID=426704 RepID=A0A511AT36_9LACT|nr:C40 family peptidase [Alkalibacterium kapii]GEK91364.1 peptidase P60 [Alkalibacterium kapii]
MKKKLVVSALTGILLMGSLATTTEVLANEYDEAIRENRSTIEKTDKKIHNLEETIDSLQVDVSNTENELSAINEDISDNEKRIAEAVDKLEKAHKEMKTLQEEVDALEIVIEKRNEQLEKQARKIQVDGQTTNFIEFIIDAESLSDIIGRIDVVSNLVGTNRKLVKAQVRDQQEVIEKQEKTEETITEQNNLAAELEGISEELEQQQLEKEVLVAQLAAEKATAEAERSRFLSQKAEAEKAVVELVSAREEAAEAARQSLENRNTENNSSSVESEVSVSSSSQTSNTNSTSDSNKTNNKSEQQTSKPKPKPAPEASSNGVTWGQISSYANGVLGTPYLYGGSTTSAFDCSGFTSYVFGKVGVSLPRSAAGQYAASQKVSNPRPGDLVFFSANGSRVTHVGIYVGNGRFIGAQTSTGVAYTSVHTNYWGPKLVGYGRY